MSEVNEAAERIIEHINAVTANLDNNERAMVLLFVSEMVKCAIQLDIRDTLRPRKRKEADDGETA